MEGEERVEVRIKVQVPGEPVQWVQEADEGLEIVPSTDMATRYRDMGEAMERVEQIAPDMPDATLSVIEEGWVGDWFTVDPTDAAFWRYRED